jgi:hypothetical protein
MPIGTGATRGKLQVTGVPHMHARPTVHADGVFPVRYAEPAARRARSSVLSTLP